MLFKKSLLNCDCKKDIKYSEWNYINEYNKYNK